MKEHIQGFIAFIRKQGVLGLAIGFLLGGAIQKLITAFVNDLVNPVLGMVMGVTSGMKDAFIQIGPAKVLWGDFVNSLIDFFILAAVVYAVVRLMGTDTEHTR